MTQLCKAFLVGIVAVATVSGILSSSAFIPNDTAPNSDDMAMSLPEAHASLETENYKILREHCTQENFCYLIVYIPARLFEERILKDIVSKISKKYRDTKSLTLNMFDDFELAKSFASDKRDPVNLFGDVRGRYIRGGDKEFLIFSADGMRLQDSECIRTIDLKSVSR